MGFCLVLKSVSLNDLVKKMTVILMVAEPLVSVCKIFTAENKQETHQEMR